MTRPRFEVVRTHDGYHVRFVPVVGRTWNSGSVRTRREALVDVYQLTGATVQQVAERAYVDSRAHGVVEVRDVDETPHGPTSRCRCGCQRAVEASVDGEVYVGPVTPDGTNT